MLRYYTEKGPEQWAKKKNPRVYQSKIDEWKLTTGERKRILLNNIYGVDIDTQAVEVTKLSLLLKVLEGENQASLDNQLRLFHERALPDLSDNIKCGNSLIGPDFYEGRQLELFDDDEMYRINAFDWGAEFPGVFKKTKTKKVMARPSAVTKNNLTTDCTDYTDLRKESERNSITEYGGGFDAVIGNPPYVDIKTMPEIDVGYIFSRYKTANNRINLFAAFVEKSLQLVKQSGFRFSMIVPTALLAQSSYCELRKHILSTFNIEAIARLPNESFGSVAGEVKVDTVIVVIGQRTKVKNGTTVIGYAGYERISKIDPATAHVYGTIHQERWCRNSDTIWSINTTDIEELILEKCEKNAIALNDCVELCLGLTPYDKYKGHTQKQIKQKSFHADNKKDETFKPLLAGNDVRRYNTQWNGQKWISYGPWLGAAREQKFFTEKRILVKQIIDWSSKRIWASLTDQELYNTQNAFNLLGNRTYALEYLLGLLNSRLMTFYHRKKYLDEFKMRFQKSIQ